MAHYIVQDPAGLVARRQELELARNIASDAAGALNEVANHTPWRGNTATRVLNSVAQQRRDLSRVINELQSAIDSVDRHRLWCDVQRGELKRLENRVRTWIRAYNAMPPDRQAASPVKPVNLGALPPQFNTKWRELFTYLRNHGIPV